MKTITLDYNTYLSEIKTALGDAEIKLREEFRRDIKLVYGDDLELFYKKLSSINNAMDSRRLIETYERYMGFRK